MILYFLLSSSCAGPLLFCNPRAHYSHYIPGCVLGDIVHTEYDVGGVPSDCAFPQSYTNPFLSAQCILTEMMEPENTNAKEITLKNLPQARFYFYFLKICLCILESERQHARKSTGRGQRQSQVDSGLSTEPNTGLDLRTLR